MNNDIKYGVIELLKSLPICDINTTGTQYVVKCPFSFCDDARKSNHGHFSIHIDVNSDTPMLYRCFKCDSSGILNTHILEELGLYVNTELNDEIRKFNKKIIKKNKYIDNSVENYQAPIYSYSILNDKKRKYINDRLGTEYTYEDLKDIKVILDIFEFMKANDIKVIPNVEFKYLKMINENYVGFLSTNNNCIVFRCIKKGVKLKRYIKVVINPTNINGNTFYSIPNVIDLLYTDDIHIHITEGVFDILSVYSNLNENNKKNHFYYASCGFGYLTILRYLIFNGINSGLNIHIYSDKDKTDRDHRHYLFNKSNLSDWFKSIYIHRNTYINESSIIEKDYGVPKEKIIDSIYRLK